MKKVTAIVVLFIIVFGCSSNDGKCNNVNVSPAENIAVHVLKVLVSLETSPHEGGLGERVVRENILGTYVPMIVKELKKEDPNLTDLEATTHAYGCIMSTWKRVEECSAEKLPECPGLIIFKHIIEEGDGEPLPNRTPTTLESVKVDTSVY